VIPARAEGSPGEAQSDPITALIRDGAYKEAAALLAREHARAIGRLCMAMLGEQQEADDAMQEALLSAHRSMATFRGEGSIRGWALCIARRVCARRIALKSAPPERRLALVHDAAVDHDTPADVLESRRRARRVREALAHLKPSERDLVLLRFEGGVPFRDIAESLGIEETAARKRASRALGRLRQLLKDEIDR
jgi:RNA polymerase sigma-70 factor (ECF subfamily)